MGNVIPTVGCTPVLPTVYDNSLSYEEQINKILYYINNYVVSDEELKDTLNSVNSVTVKNVAHLLGYGSLAEPIQLSCLGLEDNTCLYFARGTFFIEYETIEDIENLTFIMPEATLIGVGDMILDFSGCPGLKLLGGVMDGDGRCQYSFQVSNCKHAMIVGCEFKNFGNAMVENVAGLRVFGDCSGFLVSNCYFHSLTAGVVSDDGYIHAYGLLVNRLSSSGAYSSTGLVTNCNFENIAAMDTTQKGDGDGIFIQAPPYLEDGEVVYPECKVEISNCYFDGCKKRALKVATIGSRITNCVMRGEYWFACIDLQYGNCYVENCVLENLSDYNGSITSCFISSDGGFTVKDCWMSAPYTYVDPDDGSSTPTYHPGVRFNSRLPASVIDDDVKWDDCWIIGCTFDGVSRGVFAYDSNDNPPTYDIRGIHIMNCYFGDFNQSHCVDISTTRFNSIDVFEMVNFQLRYGDTRQEVAAQITRNTFTYPLGIGCTINRCFNYYSDYWLNEPMSGYDNLPDCVHGQIIYAGDNMGGITYKRYSGSGSIIKGDRNPNNTTATLARQLLYNSKLGDIYIDASGGAVYICTTAGAQSSIGTWTQI